MIYLKLLFILASVCYGANGLRILCFLPYPGKSHHMVFEPILQELVTRGHNLTVVSFFPASSPHPNRRDVSLVGLAPLNVEVVDLKSLDYSWFGLERYFAHVPPVTGLAKSNLELCKKLLDNIVFDEFLKAKGDYDLILVEHFNSDCMLGIVHNYGVPSIGLQSCAVLPWTPSRVGAPDNPSYVPGMTLPLTEEMNFIEKIENAFFLAFYFIWYELAIRQKEQKILEEKFGRTLPPIEDIAKNASAILVNTHHSLNGVRVVPPAIVEIGGVHLYNKSIHPLNSELDKWVSEAEHGVILFSFGSLIRGSTLPPKYLNAFVNVFAKLPQRVLWKWETDVIDNLPSNVRIMKWIPQYDLLHHPNCVAFITHGGLLSITEAVASGVPMLTIPILGDQFGNAVHVKRSGIGEMLRFNEITEKSLYETLSKVLSPTMQERAKEFREIWLDRPLPPMDTAIFYIEYIGRHKKVTLTSHARWLSRFQLALLDVILFLLVLFGLPIYLLIRFCTFKTKNKLKQS